VTALDYFKLIGSVAGIVALGTNIVMALCGFGSQKQRRRGEQAKMPAHCRKNVSAEEIADAIKTTLASSRGHFDD